MQRKRRSKDIPFVYECVCCEKQVRDPYTKGWIHFYGHIAVAFGHLPRAQGGHGISNELNDEFYCCSLDCWIDHFCARLAWPHPAKDKHGI